MTELAEYVREARSRAAETDYSDFSGDFWGRDDIIDYYARLPSDEYNDYLAKSVVSLASDNCILVIGGAAGRLERRILQLDKDLEVLGVDSSKSMIRKSREISRKAELDTRFLPICGDAHNLPFKSDSANLVVAGGFMRYFGLDDRLVLTEKMRKIASDYVLLAEGRVESVLQNLEQKLDCETSFSSKPVDSINMTLYFEFLNMYQDNRDFKKKVSERKSSEESYWEFLRELAGSSNKEIHQLEVVATTS